MKSTTPQQASMGGSEQKDPLPEHSNNTKDV